MDRSAKVIVLFFGVVFGLVTFVNHYNFRTSSSDLGIYLKAIYDYSHFSINHCTLLVPNLNNKWSDHFSIFQVVFSPFRYLFGTYTLLIFQWLFILIGGVGAYRFVRDCTNWPELAPIILVHYYSIFGIYSALSFDYHDNVIGASMLTWMFYFLKQENWKWLAITTVCMLLTKETIAIWLFFVFFSLTLFPFVKNRQQRIITISLSILSLAYFLVVTKWIMPSLANNPGQVYSHFNYSALGKSYTEAIQFVVTHPLKTIEIMFTNHTGNKWGEGAKPEFFITLLLSGGLALLVKPRYLLMAIPIIGLKVFNDDIAKWGINYQYNIEFVPLLALAVSDLAGNFNRVKWRYYVSIALTITCITITIVKLGHRRSQWYSQEKSNFFTTKHYKQNFNLSQLYDALQLIPDDAAVSAHSYLVPHLAFRDDIYEFPQVENSQYIALLLNSGTYPITAEVFSKKLDELKSNPEWDLVYDQNQTLLFKRRNQMNSNPQ